MAGWFATKIRNSRIRAQARLAEGLFSQMAAQDRAYVLLFMTALKMDFRRGEPGEFNIFETLDNPFVCEQEQLEQVFLVVDTLRNNAVNGLETLDRNWKTLTGTGLPDFAKYQMSASINMAHLLSITAGCGLVPDTRQRVSQVWDLMRDSHSSLAQAIENWWEIMHRHKRFGIPIGDDMQIPPSDDWIKEAKYVPKAFALGN